MTTKANAHFDAEMAQRMKGIVRNSCRCPICHNLVPIGGYHIVQCNGPRRKGSAGGTNAATIKAS